MKLAASQAVAGDLAFYGYASAIEAGVTAGPRRPKSTGIAMTLAATSAELLAGHVKQANAPPSPGDRPSKLTSVEFRTSGPTAVTCLAANAPWVKWPT